MGQCSNIFLISPVDQVSGNGHFTAVKRVDCTNFQKVLSRRKSLKNHNSFVINSFLSPFSAIVPSRKVFSEYLAKKFTHTPEFPTFDKRGQSVFF